MAGSICFGTLIQKRTYLTVGTVWHPLSLCYSRCNLFNKDVSTVSSI